MARMFVLNDEVLVRAPIERCFLLSTSVALVETVLRMHPVRGRTRGLVQGGDRVLWKGWQLGLPQVHESLIGPYERPLFFRDQMVRGRFRSFEHDHRFEQVGDGLVRMHDEVRFTMPLGRLGALVGEWILVPHIRGLLRRRFAGLQRIAEGDDWRRYLPETDGGGQHSGLHGGNA